MEVATTSALPLLIEHAWPDPQQLTREDGLAWLESLPPLQKLLRDSTVTHVSHDSDLLNTASERAWCDLSLPASQYEDGAIPLASLSSQQPHLPQAWITFCNLDVGTEGARLTVLDSLSLREQELGRIVREWQQLATEDGFQILEAVEDPALSWRVTAPWLTELRQASWKRVSPPGVRVDRWLGALHNDATKRLRRLQNEFQMLMYTHALNDERTARGDLPVNSFWLHGAGAVPSDARRRPCEWSQAITRSRDHVDAWKVAWQETADLMAQALGRGAEVRLCGETGWLALSTSPRGRFETFTHHFFSAFRPMSPKNMISVL